jgi:hypothetical protein
MKANGLPIDYKQRKGDVVLLRATVSYNWTPDHADEFLVTVEGRSTAILIKRASIVGIDRLRFDIGETVRRIGCGPEGKIVAINGDFAWVNFGLPEAEGEVIRLSKLERVDEAPQEPDDQEIAAEAPPSPSVAA